MRLLFNPSNEIFFQKIEGDKMKGSIEMSNPTSDTIFAFKIKCTNPDLFIVNPLKGLIKAGQKLNIEYITADSVNLDFARELVSKHKFLIEFVPIASQLSLPNFKSQQSDRKKYYINMDSIRGSRLFKDNEKMSIHSGVSNRMSYISMKNQNQKPSRDRQYQTPRKFGERGSSNSPVKNGQQNLHEKYSSLKNDLEDLHRQRQQIINQMSSSKKSSSNNLKKIIVFVVFFFIGIVLGNKVEGFIQQRRREEEEQREKQSSKPWRLFGFLDFLYDEVDPNDL